MSRLGNNLKPLGTLFLLLLLLLCAAQPARAQFHDWLPYYKQAYRFKWGDKCDELLSRPRNVGGWCEDISDCILQNSPETQKANMSGAGVLMGLVPTILCTIGPSPEEMALLFDHRPLLALLVSLASPGIYFTRMFSDTDPELPLNDRKPDDLNLWIPKGAMAFLVSVGQYALALLSIANITWISVDLAYKSIVSWSCPNKWWVFGWGASPVIIHIIAAIVFKCTTSRLTPKIKARNLVQWLGRLEFSPCSCRPRPSYKVNTRVGAQLARYIAPAISYVHLVVGTAVLSSLLYVPFRDALQFVARWILSGVVARMIMAYELACLSQNIEESEERAGYRQPLAHGRDGEATASIPMASI